MGVYNLDKIFAAESVAVVGASEKSGSIGHSLMRNMMEAGFQGALIPVNPSYRSILGHRAYRSVEEIEHSFDLAVIATPIATVPGIVRGCVELGARGAVIISAGGKEIGAKGREIEEQILLEAEKGSLRIVGPNCLGIICPTTHINASFASHTPRDGQLAFISQSGAICTAMLDISLKEQLGFRYFVSIGSMLDVDFGDLIDYMGSDPHVRSILLYVESLTGFRKFMSAARAVSRLKPIVILKSGRSSAGARAASSHTGAMAGSDSVYDAAFRRAGAVRVQSIRDFFDCAELLAKQPRPKGPRVTVITNSGGPGVMAADAIAECGLEISPLSKETLSNLNQILPPQWSRGNPIDILGDATAERYADVVDCCIQAKDTDGLLVILNPQAMTDPAEVALALTQSLSKKAYPVFTSWMGGRDVEKGIEVLNNAGIPTYGTPEEAIRAFMYLHHYSQNLQMLEEIPSKLAREIKPDPDKARRLIRLGLSRQSGLLTEAESKSLLAAYSIPVNRTEPAATVEEAVRLAHQMGFPLVMKIDSLDITHKTEADGVQLNLRSEENIRNAFTRIMEGAHKYDPDARVSGVTLQPMVTQPDVEILLGAKRDPNFGPVILFGMGGIYTEVFQDRALALPPLNRSLARMLMGETKVFRLLQGYRNRPAANMELLEEMVIGLSQLLVDFPEISELDMNPVIVQAGKPFAADARVFLMPSEQPSPLHLVISPYPTRYEESGLEADGIRLMIRPIKPEDAPLLVRLFETLSPTSIYLRFFTPMKSLPHHMLARFTQIDYDREMALVALDESAEEETILGVARVIGHPDGKRGEFAVVVGDPWHGKGIGANLLRRCLCIMKERGMGVVWGTVLRENTQMIKLGKKLGFKVSSIPGTNEYELSIDLSSADL